MSRRVLPPLRTWFGVLLVCALFVCLSGLARPTMAMSMPMAMPGSMKTAPHAVADERGSHASAPTVAESAPDPGPYCPSAEEQCAAPKATLAQDWPSGHVAAVSPRAVGCSPVLLVAQPGAPPPAVAPPDLHWLCVSRT
ncbi:hypothetical protein J7E96_31270 [Streptomyces sp. ISL-96]|uniref:hypothetical protein n=1 Tax=Streptomyces sp. ISL-96 TaxID=2819191 RepID=UPI001BEA4DB8|nr:hypothetical protein [Streptomyces sp. ISL-96]MBT2492913.1 hypothetical protein [Streptomyces sp. ISL-96]